MSRQSAILLVADEPSDCPPGFLVVETVGKTVSTIMASSSELLSSGERKTLSQIVELVEQVPDVLIEPNGRINRAWDQAMAH